MKSLIVSLLVGLSCAVQAQTPPQFFMPKSLLIDNGATVSSVVTLDTANLEFLCASKQVCHARRTHFWNAGKDDVICRVCGSAGFEGGTNAWQYPTWTKESMIVTNATCLSFDSTDGPSVKEIASGRGVLVKVSEDQIRKLAQSGVFCGLKGHCWMPVANRSYLQCSICLKKGRKPKDELTATNSYIFDGHVLKLEPICQ